MSIYAVVKRMSKTRKGKGFSRDELKEVGLSTNDALKFRIPIDVKRSTKHDENVKTLKVYARKLKRDLSVKEEKAKIVKLTEVRGVGPIIAEKLTAAGIHNVNELVASTPKSVAKAIGSSAGRASKLIKDARSVLEEN